MSRPLPLPPSHHRPCSFLFFFHDTATTEIYTLSLHDALPICDDWPGFFLSFRLEPQLNRAGLSLGFSSLEKRSEEHTSELQSHVNLVCRLLLEKKKRIMTR